MSNLESLEIDGFLLVAVGVTGAWLVLGVLVDFWWARRMDGRGRRLLPVWLHSLVVSAAAFVSIPRVAQAFQTPTTASTDSESGRQAKDFDHLFLGSLAANAGFATFHLRRHMACLRRIKFGGNDKPTVVDRPEGTHPVVPCREWRIVVRVLGTPVVESSTGTTVTFEKGKSLELVVWMVEHRENSTRSAARSALWDEEVKDATFSNVVSEARRALQSADPLTDEEWIPRTFSDDLPLHPAVVTDSELLDVALQNFVNDPTRYRKDLVDQLRGVRNLPFSGVNFSWADGEGITTSHVIKVVRAAVLLAEHAIDCNDNGLLFMATEKGLRVLPGHEELVSLRMKGHARSGNRSAIKYEWESYTRAIEADSWVGATPSPELEKLARELSKA